MKKLTNLFLILLLTLATVFCVTACDVGKNQTVTYEITVDTKNVSVDTGKIKVSLYALDGTAVEERGLTEGKAKFELQADSYVATLSGLDEKVSFSSFLLTSSSRKVTITVSNSEYDDLMDYYSYTFSVVMLSGKYNLSDVYAQICDVYLCSDDLTFDSSLVADVTISSVTGDECEAKAFDNTIKYPTDNEIYHKTFTLDLNKRFYIIQLQES